LTTYLKPHLATQTSIKLMLGSFLKEDRRRKNLSFRRGRGEKGRIGRGTRPDQTKGKKSGSHKSLQMIDTNAKWAIQRGINDFQGGKRSTLKIEKQTGKRKARYLVNEIEKLSTRVRRLERNVVKRPTGISKPGGEPGCL